MPSSLKLLYIPVRSCYISSMDFLNIARKYRPKSFSEVVGQGISCKILSNSILLNRIPKAVLLSGIRGTGKTTLARIFAKALNCENFAGDVCGVCNSCKEADNGSHPDILEFDAASNNGVDFVRELEAVFRQVENYKRRVIIFDEVHMFTTQAQNALLKTLEEPPANLTFILSTTEPERLETTMRSRCLSMPLRPLNSADVSANLRHVVSMEGRVASDDFIETLALQGGGSLRDVQQLLDQLMLASGDGPLDVAFLEESIGCVSTAQYKQLAAVLCSMDLKLALEQLEIWSSSGMDLELLFTDGLPNLLRDFAMVEAGIISGVQLISGIPAGLIKSKLTFDRSYIKMISAQWEKALGTMKHTARPKVVWTMFFISIFAPDPTRG